MKRPLRNREEDGNKKEERSGTGKCWLCPMIIAI